MCSYNKYIDLESIFTDKTIDYLKLHNYNFEGNLHYYSLKSLLEKKHDIFTDLIINGIYDNNYDIQIDYRNLLCTMLDFRYIDEKYYKGIIEVDILNTLNKKDRNNWLYRSYMIFNMDEKLICKILGNSKKTIDFCSRKKNLKFYKKI